MELQQALAQATKGMAAMAAGPWKAPVQVSAAMLQWRNTLTGGPWTSYIKGPIPHSEFTEKFIVIKVLTKITTKHKKMMKCEVKSNFIIKAKLSSKLL